MENLESELGHKFAPTYHSSKGEANCLVELEPRREPTFARGYPPWEPYVYFSSYLLATHGDERFYEITYLTIWEWDAGTETRVGVQGSHQWDTELSAVLAVGRGRDLGSYTMRQAYFAAHEGVKFMKVLSLDNSHYFRPRRLRGHGPEVYWSKGKHASFADLRRLRGSTAADSYVTPGKVARPGQYTLVDAGTLENPSPAAAWIRYSKGWGAQRISPIHDKLRRRLWDAGGKQLLRLRTVTEEDIKAVQSVLGVEETGQFDHATVQKGATELPADLLWSTQAINKDDVVRMAKRDIDVAPLL